MEKQIRKNTQSLAALQKQLNALPPMGKRSVAQTAEASRLSSLILDAKELLQENGAAEKVYQQQQKMLANEKVVQETLLNFTFLKGDDPETVSHNAAVRQRIVSWLSLPKNYFSLTGRNTLVGATLSFLKDASSARLRGGAFGSLTDAQWAELAEAVRSYRVEEIALNGALPGNTVKLPEATSATARYADNTFSFLVDDVFDKDNPVVLTLAKMYKSLGIETSSAAVGKQKEKVLDKLLKPFYSLPSWNPITFGSLDYSARVWDMTEGADSTTLYGNIPKTEVAGAMANRRTTEAPPVEALTEVALSGEQMLRARTVGKEGVLGAQGHPDYVEGVPVKVWQEDGSYVDSAPRSVALASFAGRFYTNVEATYDGNPISAEGDLNLLTFAGYDVSTHMSWQDAKATSDFAVSDPNRIFNATLLAMQKDPIYANMLDGADLLSMSMEELLDTGFDPAKLQFKVRYLHPDSVPLLKEFSNNGFFAGNAFSGNTVNAVGLIADFWSYVNPKGQTQGIQSAKGKGVAIHQVEPLGADVFSTLYESGLSDIQHMLDQAALKILRSDFGKSFRFGPAAMNAFTAMLKQALLLRGFVNGEPRAMSMQEAISKQLRGEGLGFDARPELVRLSPRALRASLGDISAYSLATVSEGQMIDPNEYETFDPTPAGTSTRVARMPNLLKTAEDAGGVSFSKPSLASALPKATTIRSISSTRKGVDTRERNYRAQTRAALRKTREATLGKRASLKNTNLELVQTFTAANLAKIPIKASPNPVSFGNAAVYNVNIAKGKAAQVRGELQKPASDRYVTQNDDAHRAAWIVSPAKMSPHEGIIKFSEVGKENTDGLHIVEQDIALVPLAEFESLLAKATMKEEDQKLPDLMRNLAATGATIYLDPRGTGNDTLVELSSLLQKHLGYRKLEGYSTVFIPDYDPPGLMERSLAIAGMTHTSSSAEDSLIFAVGETDTSHEQGAFMFTGAPTKGIVSQGLIPAEYAPGFSLPEDAQTVGELYERLALLYKEELPFLHDMAGVAKDKKGQEQFNLAMEKLLRHWESLAPDRLYAGYKEFLPRDLRIGDILPLYNAETQQLILLRYGHKLATLEPQFVKTLATSTKPEELSVAPAEVDATRHYPEGSITDVSGGNARSVVAKVWSTFNNDMYAKLHLVGQNLKVFPVRSEDAEILFYEGPLFEHRKLDGFLASTDVREKGGQYVTNFSDGLKYLGGNFYTPLGEELFGLQWKNANAEDKAFLSSSTKKLLTNYMSEASKLDPQTAQTLIASGNAFMVVEQALEGSTDLHQNIAEFVNRVRKSLRKGGLTPSQYVVLQILAHLATEGAHLENTVEFAGVVSASSVQRGGYSNSPALSFSRTLDNAPRVVREYLFKNVVATPLSKEWTLNYDWSFTKQVGSKSKTVRMMFAPYIVKGDGPEAKEAVDIAKAGKGQAISDHYNSLAAFATGASPYSAEYSKKLSRREALFKRDTTKEVAMFAEIIRASGTSNIRLQTPTTTLGKEYMARTHRSMLRTRKALTFFEDSLPEDVDRYYAERSQVAAILNLGVFQEDKIDYWVRQVLFKLSNKDGTVGEVSVTEALAALGDVKANLLEGRMPVAGSAVYVLSLEDLRQVYLANRTKGHWAPRVEGEKVKTWEAWVAAALQVEEDTIIDPMVLKVRDGLIHTYMGQSAAPMLPISSNALVAAGLLDESSLLPRLSLNPRLQEALMDLTNADNQPVTIDSVVERALGTQEQSQRLRGREFLKSLNKHRRAQWSQAPAVEMNEEQLQKFGPQYSSNTAQMAPIVEVLTSLRVITSLANPALYISAYGESFYRKMLMGTVDILSGSNVGTTAKLTAKASEASQKILPNGVTSSLENAFGKARLSSEDLQTIELATRGLESSKELMTNLWSEGNYQSSLANKGHVLRGLGRLSNAVGRMQDPMFGMKPTKAAKIYMENVVSAVLADPYSYKETAVQLASKLSADGMYVANNYPQLHDQAIATFKNLRSIKPTAPSLFLSTSLQSMMRSSSYSRQITGTAVWLPVMFSNFAFNVATTMTGMQGPMALLSVALHGKKKPGWWKAAQRGIAGETSFSGDPVTVSETFDMTPALESFDLTKAFLQSGVSITNLFLGTLLVGSLGLTGEDEEEKKRRKRARMTNNSYVYDPREIQNDFRNSQAVFLEQIPFLGPLFSVALSDNEIGYKSMANPHWMIKQFLSPIMGLQRFAETGDFRNVMWGFEDGLLSFPLINTMMWGQTQRMVDEMNANITEAGIVGNGDSRPETVSWMTNIVMAYENMLFENSFINQVYIGKDALDRDPYIKPLLENNEMLLDKEGNPMQTDAMAEYVDEATGEIKKGYLKREGLDLQGHVFAENRLGVAFAMSLLTGQWNMDSSYIRTNMAPKVRGISLEEMDQEVAEGMLLSYFDQASGTEVLTDKGARAVFQGLYKGTVAPNSAALAGVHIPYEMREKISEAWKEELVTEGMQKYGLNEWDAKQYMWAIWKGDEYTNGVGLNDIIWDENIVPYKSKIEYTQLNTTYIPGPDGNFWATGVKRSTLMAALGLAPVTGYHTDEHSGQGLDERLNTTDLVYGLNTGMRALVRKDESVDSTTMDNKLQDLQKGMEKILNTNFNKLLDELRDNGSGGYSGYGYGGRGYSRGGYSRGGYSGGGGYSFTRLNAPPRNITPYANDARSPSVSNPQIRRGYIRRERYSSQRGRLNQWQ